MRNALQQDLDLWEVWIEYDQFHPEHFGTLYVHGEIATNKKICPRLTKISKDGSQLTLQLPTKSEVDGCLKEVLYSEPIKNLNQYTSVCICEGDEVVEVLDDIEVMI
jgi:hypothetical protein